MIGLVNATRLKLESKCGKKKFNFFPKFDNFFQKKEDIVIELSLLI